ncbi:hypothetical protein [Embleya sp. NPDC001921]
MITNDAKSNRDSSLDSSGLFRWLWASLPETRPHLAHLLRDAEREAAENGEDLANEIICDSVNPYGILSEGFFWPVVVASVESGDVSMMVKIANTIEIILASSDEDLLAAADSRVVAPLSGQAEYWTVFRPFAGPRLLATAAWM